MHLLRCLASGTAAVGLLATVPLTGHASPSAATLRGTAAGSLSTLDTVTAEYRMNEPFGTTVMRDSSGNRLDGAVNPAGVDAGVSYDGATGYRWIHRAPEQAPASPERVIRVPDNSGLEPGDGSFTIELRYRTKENFGNITQKGQSTTRGGQWKIQAPKGVPSCLFKGSLGRVATGAKTPLNDNRWHTLTCVLTSSAVTMYVDGAFRNKQNGRTGRIDNAIAMTIGGKLNCDQVEVTCDYFSGQIDYVKITKPVAAPV